MSHGKVKTFNEKTGWAVLPYGTQLKANENMPIKRSKKMWKRKDLQAAINGNLMACPTAQDSESL